MSIARNPRLKRTKSSSRNQGTSQRSGLFAGMLLPQFRCHGLQLHGFPQHGIVAMPLHEIRTAHECAVFGRTSVIVPEIKVDEVNRMRKWRAADGAIGAQTVHQSFG